METVVHGGNQRGVGIRHGQRRIGQHHGQHGGHPRTDHAGPLAHAGNPDGPAAQFQGASGDLVRLVGCGDAAGSGQKGRFVAAQTVGGRTDSHGDLVHRQKHADDSGRHYQGLIRAGATSGGRQLRHRLGIQQTSLARTRIGVARIDDDRADAVGRRPLAVDRDRRSTHQVRRVHAGRHRGLVRHNQGQIFTRRIGLDSARDAGKSKAARYANRHGLSQGSGSEGQGISDFRGLTTAAPWSRGIRTSS